MGLHINLYSQNNCTCVIINIYILYIGIFHKKNDENAFVMSLANL